jgi:hypothetical protein
MMYCLHQQSQSWPCLRGRPLVPLCREQEIDGLARLVHTWQDITHLPTAA